MKLFRVLAVTVLMAGLATVGLVAEATVPPATQMATAAQKFLDSLSPELRAKATFPYEDKERVHWAFIPLQDKERKPTRKGLRFEEMNEKQREAALALLKAGTSADGYKKATTIMSLEEVLRDLEKRGAMVRNPNWYFVTVFGTPSKTGAWGWRMEGHHLSVNFTLDKGEVVAATPFFFGANPADIKAGPRKGLRTLPEAEDTARDLFKALTDDQRKVALQAKPFPEIDAIPAAKVEKPVGVPGKQMTKEQQALLLKVLKAYTDRMPEPVGATELAAATKGGLDEVYFAYTGGTEPGKPYTYRVQGPAFLVQFLNVQADSAGNPANHIHSVWRRLPADFALKAG